MADFTRRRKFTTERPILKVAAGLSVGVHTFQLVVTDEQGNQSRAVKVKVKIFKPRIPVLPGRGGVVLDVTRPIPIPIR